MTAFFAWAVNVCIVDKYFFCYFVRCLFGLYWFVYVISDSRENLLFRKNNDNIDDHFSDSKCFLLFWKYRDRLLLKGLDVAKF